METKWLDLTESEMMDHLEENFTDYTIEKERGKWLSFRMNKVCVDFEYQTIYVYTYSEKELSSDTKRKWYFSFYNMYWKESKEVAITVGITQYFKEKYEELSKLENQVKKVTNKILIINTDDSDIRDWRIKQILD